MGEKEMKKIIVVMSLLLFAITVQAQTDPVSQATTTLNTDETALVQQINAADTLWDTFWTCSLSNMENQILGLLPIQCPADGTIITNAQVLDAQKLAGLTALTIALDYTNLNSAEQAVTAAQIGIVTVSVQNLQQLEVTDATGIQQHGVSIQTLQQQEASDAANIQTLQQQNTLAQGLIQALQQQGSMANTQIQTLQGQVSALQTQVSTANVQIQTLQGQEAVDHAQILTLQGQVSTLQTQMNNLCAHFVGKC
jgi:hypothetical protein